MAFINLKSIPSSFFCRAILPSVLLISATALAQQPDTAVMAKLMKQYQNENSVYVNYSKKLEIKYENSELIANTYTKSERLLTSDHSQANDHYDHVAGNYFCQLTQIDAEAFVPQSSGEYKRITSYNTFAAGGGDGEITDDAQYITSFTGLTKGSVIRFSATQNHRDLTALPIFITAERYPIVHAEYEVEAPDFVDVKFVLKGENTTGIRQTKEHRNGKTIYKFTADNIPGYKSFSNARSPLYYLPQVICYISSFRLPGETKDSLLLSDAAHLYKNQFKYVGNLNVKKDPALQKIVSDITRDDKTQRQKAEHIYQWVQKNMHYIAIEIGIGGWLPREADTVCKRKYGDCKDMASLLVAMGRMAGLETYFTWIGTTDLPFTFEETPIPNVSNHMICALKLNDEWIFMDGTHSNLPFGANRDDIQGKEAMIAIDKNTFKIVTIPTVAADKNLTIDSTYMRISPVNDEDLTGTVKEQFEGYQAWNTGFQLSYETKEKEEKEKAVTNLTRRGTNKFVLDKYDIDIKDGGRTGITVNGDFTIGNYVNKSGKNYIVNMNLVRRFKNNYIDTAERVAPYFFDYKNAAKEVVVFELPKGYKVTSLPKNASGKLNDLWNYSITYKNDGKKIVLTKEYKLNTLSISKHDFVAHNKEIAKLDKEYQESVVLTAIN